MVVYLYTRCPLPLSDNFPLGVYFVKVGRHRGKKKLENAGGEKGGGNGALKCTGHWRMASDPIKQLGYRSGKQSLSMEIDEIFLHCRLMMTAVHLCIGQFWSLQHTTSQHIRNDSHGVSSPNGRLVLEDWVKILDSDSIGSRYSQFHHLVLNVFFHSIITHDCISSILVLIFLFLDASWS